MKATIYHLNGDTAYDKLMNHTVGIGSTEASSGVVRICEKSGSVYPPPLVKMSFISSHRLFLRKGCFSADLFYNSKTAGR